MTGVLSTSYLSFVNALCCLGVIIGSVVAVQQYAGAVGGVKTGDGAYLGALTGGAGALLGSLFDVALRPLGLDSQSIMQGMLESLSRQEGQQNLSPGAMEQLQGGGGASMMIVGLIINLVVYAIFGAIGGAIGAALFGDDAGGDNGTVQTAEAEVLE